MAGALCVHKGFKVFRFTLGRFAHLRYVGIARLYC